MDVIMNRATLGDSFVKGITAELVKIRDQVDRDYSLANKGTLGIQNIDGTALFKTMSSVKAREEMNGVSQIGKLEFTTEGEDYKSDSFISTYRTQWNFAKYTQSITATEEMIDDGVVSKALDKTRKLLIAGKRTVNQQMFDVFNKAFTAQASLPEYLTFYGDGKPLCDTAHPIKGTGGSQSNKSASAIPLSEANIETARIALMEQLGDKAGELLNYGSSNIILLVPPALEKLAVILTKSTKRSGTANNDVNIYDGTVTVMSTKWISAAAGGSDTAWFLIDSMLSPLVFYQRRPLALGTPYPTNSNKNMTWDISARHQVGNDEWKGLWGSAGA